MSKPTGRTWLAVGARGLTHQIAATERQPELPWRFDGARIEKVESHPARSCQLVVAALNDGLRLESAMVGDAPFHWTELHAVDIAAVTVLHCLLEGFDPSTALEPIEEEVNPFTKEVIRRTLFDRAFESFDAVLDGEIVSSKKVFEAVADGRSFGPLDALVSRLPASLVARLGAMPEATTNEVSRRWAMQCAALREIHHRFPDLSDGSARRSLEALVAAAKVAVAAKHELFIWAAG